MDRGTSNPKNFLFRIIENFGSQAIQLVISIVLARLLVPENYGAVAIASTLITILTSIVQSSFNAPLVQKKGLTDVDLCSSFIMMFILASGLYVVLFLCAPLISVLYSMPELTSVIRVLGIVLIIGSWNSIQLALIYRNTRFRESLIINLFTILVQGLVGIALAYLGYGVWSLVFSQITAQVMLAILYGLCNHWRPRLYFSRQSIRSIWKIGLPLFGAELLTIASTNINPMIIGLKYSNADLGLYQKGHTIPTTIVNGIVTACTTVYLPMMSRLQDEKQRLLEMLREGSRMATYLIVPIALGLCAISKEFVLLILGERWEQAIPYMQLSCIALAFYPLRIRLQAIKAIGEAKHALTTNAVHAISSCTLLFISIYISLEAVTFSMILAELFFAGTSGMYLKRDLGYAWLDQIRDILPSYMMSAAMCAMVMGVEYLMPTVSFLSLFTKIIVGIGTYVEMTFIFCPRALTTILISFSGNCED